jgi:hypothetical protein
MLQKICEGWLNVTFLGKRPESFWWGSFWVFWKKGAPLGAANAEESWRFW